MFLRSRGEQRWTGLFAQLNTRGEAGNFESQNFGRHCPWTPLRKYKTGVVPQGTMDQNKRLLVVSDQLPDCDLLCNAVNTETTVVRVCYKEDRLSTLAAALKQAAGVNAGPLEVAHYAPPLFALLQWRLKPIALFRGLGLWITLSNRAETTSCASSRVSACARPPWLSLLYKGSSRGSRNCWSHYRRAVTLQSGNLVGDWTFWGAPAQRTVAW